MKDIQKATTSDACRDSQERLRVGAAVGTGGGTEERPNSGWSRLGWM